MTYRIRVIPTLVDAPHRAGLTGLLCLLWTRLKEEPSFRDVNIKPVYPKVLHATPHSFALQLDDFIVRPRFYRMSDHEFSFEKWLEVLDHSMALELRSEALDLVKNALPNLPTYDSPFWKEWRGLHTFIENLAVILKRYSNSDLEDASRSFIKYALCTAAHALVESHSIKPKDWIRSNKKTDCCDCGPCRSLKEFFANPNEIVGFFKYAEKTRKHLQYSLDLEDFKFATERNKSPFTLIIRKTNNEYTRLSNEWKSSVSEMKDRIERVYADFLKTLLGDDFATELPETVREGLNLGDSAPLQPVRASKQNRRGGTRSVAGVKRKSEVVDLTEDASD